MTINLAANSVEEFYEPPLYLPLLACGHSWACVETEGERCFCRACENKKGEREE